MKKRIVSILFLGALLAGVWWYVQSLEPGTTALEQIVQEAGDALVQVTQGVSMPPPLRATQESPTARLTRDGIENLTNIQRSDNGALIPLARNVKLDAAATAKMNDLFSKHYFEHISPSGAGPSDLAKGAGYAYAVIGENLALGNFQDDQELVQAWMDSPGHRANILNTSYSEIGVAVGQGLYEGHRTWIAVQEFAKPQSACPSIDEALKAKIKADEAAIKKAEADTDLQKAGIEALGKPHASEERDAYNRKVDTYNASIRQISDFAAQIKDEIDSYNGQVRAYNACATE